MSGDIMLKAGPNSPSGRRPAPHRWSEELRAALLGDGAGGRGATKGLYLWMATGILVTAWALQPQPARTEPATSVAGDGAGHVLYVDLKGWYRRTPDEAAVISPYDLSLNGLPASLPYVLGDWRGVDRPVDPDVSKWFADPPVSIERTYVRNDGAVVWLSAFGSRGDQSFHLFEHTPETCYPLSGWSIFDLQRQSVDLGPRPLVVNFGHADDGQGGQLAFLYVYVWEDPSRDPARGVVSLRLGAPVGSGENLDDAGTRLLEEFLPNLITSTLPWTQF